MPGKKILNSDLELQGKLTINTVPNNTGTVVTYNSTSKELSTRTNAQVISDLGLNSDLTAYVKKIGDTMSGPLVFNSNPTSILKKDMSIYPGTTGFARDMFQIIDSTGIKDSFGWFGNVTDGVVNLTYGYLGGTAYNTKSAIRWTPDGRVGIGLTSSSTPQAGYALHTVGNNYTVGNIDFTGNINSTTGELIIQKAGTNRIRTGGTAGDNLILSGASATGAVYLRPQGDTINTGEVLVNSSGVIVTQTTGTSTQWNNVSQAFIANPFFSRNSIISQGAPNTLTTLDSYLPNGGFITNYGVPTWGGTDTPAGASFGGFIKFTDTANSNGLQFYFNNGHNSLTTHRLWFRTKNGSHGATTWFEVMTTMNGVPYTGATSDLSLADKNLNFTTGSISKVENGIRTFTNVFQKSSNNVAQTGIISFKFPQAALGATMFDVTINIYEYNAKVLGKLRLSFYKSNSTSIIANGSKALWESTDNLPSTIINIGIDLAGNVSINLGEITTVWGNYVQFEVEKVKSYFNGYNTDWSKGWSQTVETVAPVVPDTYQSLINIVPEIVATRTWVDSKLAGSIPKLATSLGTSDLNTITTPGFYNQVADANATPARNYPIQRAGYLNVFKTTGNAVVQEYTSYLNEGTYKRYYSGTNWSSGWKKVLTDIDTIPQLANYLPLTGGEITGALTIKPSNSGSVFEQDVITFHDLGTGPSNIIPLAFKYGISTTSTAFIKAVSKGLNGVDGALFQFFDNSTKHTEISSVGVTSNSFVKSGGFSTQFLKANGSVDSNSYLTQAILNSQLLNYATLNGVQTFSNTITFSQSPIVPNATLIPHAVNLGQMTDYVDVSVGSVLNQVSNNFQTLNTAQSVGATKSYTSPFPFKFKTAGTKTWVLHKPNGNSLIFAPSTVVDSEDWDWANQISFNEDSSVEASKFIVRGGTAAQFQKADGSLDSNTYINTPDGFAVLLSDNTDLNANLKTGFYRGKQLVHAPDNNAGWWFITVENNDNEWVSQKAVSFGANNIGGLIYQRNLSWDGWSDWEQVWTSKQFSQTNINQWNEAYLRGLKAIERIGVSMYNRNVISYGSWNTAIPEFLVINFPEVNNNGWMYDFDIKITDLSTGISNRKEDNVLNINFNGVIYPNMIQGDVKKLNGNSLKISTVKLYRNSGGLPCIVITKPQGSLSVYKVEVSDIRSFGNYDNTHDPDIYTKFEVLNRNDINGFVEEFDYTEEVTYEFQGKKITLLGDSITWGWDNGNQTTYYPDYIKEKFKGAEVGVNGFSGGTLASDPAWNIHILAQSNIDAIINHAPDILIIMGGVNDYQTGMNIGGMGALPTSTIGSLEKALIKIRQNLPNCRVLFCTSGAYYYRPNGMPNIQSGREVNSIGYTLSQYFNACIDLCRQYSVETLNFYEDCGWFDENETTGNYNFTIDGLHFSKKAYDRLTDKQFKKLTRGY